jgi:enoyl-CoA hydratase
MPQPDSLLIERPQPGLAVLTLNRPERLNAFSRAAVDHFNATLDALGAEPELRVIILTGAGRGFCAGWDLTSGTPTPDGQAPGVVDFYQGQEAFAGMVQRLRRLDKVVIAAVNGVAVGAGFALTLASDIRLAATGASFHVGAVRIGLTSGECGISYHLPRHVGAARAFELMLTGRPLPADEALQWGLVSAVLPPDQLLPRALALAAQVLSNSPYATKHTKSLMWANLDAPSLQAALEAENHAQILALMTEDFKEAQCAFAEKRPPVFTGR